MTRQEFIQEAALRLVATQPDKFMCEIAELAKSLANCVYGLEEEEPQIPYSDEPISNLIREIDRMDIEERDRRMAEAKAKGHRWTFSKKGHARITQTACERENIKTISGLLAFGKLNFLNAWHIGPNVIASVDKALENLYGIKSW